MDKVKNIFRDKHYKLSECVCGISNKKMEVVKSELILRIPILIYVFIAMTLLIVSEPTTFLMDADTKKIWWPSVVGLALVIFVLTTFTVYSAVLWRRGHSLKCSFRKVLLKIL